MKLKEVWEAASRDGIEIRTPISPLCFTVKTTAAETFSVAAGTTAAADGRGERVTTSCSTSRSHPKPARAAGESKAIQIRIRSIRY